MSSSPRPSPAQSPVVPEAASWPRRMVALAVDWSACLLVVDDLYDALVSEAQ